LLVRGLNQQFAVPASQPRVLLAHLPHPLLVGHTFKSFDLLPQVLVLIKQDVHRLELTLQEVVLSDKFINIRPLHLLLQLAQLFFQLLDFRLADFEKLLGDCSVIVVCLSSVHLERHLLLLSDV
jgi:hypothetical protein